MRTAVACLLILLFLDVPAEAGRRHEPSPIPQIASSPVTITGTGTGFPGKTSAAADTFVLYGGPGTLEGKFSDAAGNPDAQGWVGVDQTEQPTLWQRSTFNAQNLNNAGPGNHAMWAGRSASQEPGWISAPGYGNSWNALLEFRATVSDPGAGQTVLMDFWFNHDSEPGYDYFHVQYDSAGTDIVVYSRDGSNRDGSDVFQAPGVQYSAQAPAPIQYAGGDYANGNTEIVLRMTATSDGAWSDEDGMWVTEAGLAQVDQITVQHADGLSFEDFEGSGPYAWNPEQAPFAGYFGRVFPRVGDLDPCVDNLTPVYGFIDDGLGPYNPAYTGSGTGGSTSINWSYGVEGGWVVNHDNGVNPVGSYQGIDNRVVSPVIPWDLPGTEDDGPNVAGAQIRFSVYVHLPLRNGIFHQWAVRSRLTGGHWSNWANRNFVYYGGGGWGQFGNWQNWQRDVGDLLIQPFGAIPDDIQLSFVVKDLAVQFAFAGTDATPSPLFDNVSVVKYDVPGPMYALRRMDLFQDAFPRNGQSDFSTQAGRNAADIALDMTRDISTGQQNTAGDSIIVDITALLPGTSVDASGLELHYALHTNPYFEDQIRGNLTSTATESPGGGLNGWDVWHGVVAGQISTTSAGAVVADRYFFSPPDEDFFYPGDILEWYIRAEDSSGNVSTYPPHLEGFGDATPHDFHAWATVHGLPSVTSSTQHPEILVLDYSLNSQAAETRRNALDQLGLREGIDYDTFVLNHTSLSGGIGSDTHGATTAQLAGYSCILMDGDDTVWLLSDGSDTGHNDKGDGYGVITEWLGQPADRLFAIFADQVVYHSSSNGWGDANGDLFLANVLGVEFVQQDNAPLIGHAVNPMVVPTGTVPAFSTPFLAGNGCTLRGSTTTLRQLNAMEAAAGGPVRTHAYQTGTGDLAAGVVWDRIEGGYRKISVTFPSGLDAMWTPQAKVAGMSARASVLGEVLGLLGSHPSGPPTDADVVPARFQVGAAQPNPFNPRTTLRLSAPRNGHVAVHIYNVRGERVATLLDGEIPTGETLVTWDGRDRQGATVASGIYIASVEGFGQIERQKLVMLK